MQQSRETGTIKDIVAKHKTNTVIADELFADDECLGQPVGRGLLCVFKLHPQFLAVAQQSSESGQIVWSGDDQYFLDACKHKHRYGVIYHGLVENRYQLLTYSLSDGVKSCARTPGQYNSFHVYIDFVLYIRLVSVSCRCKYLMVVFASCLRHSHSVICAKV